MTNKHNESLWTERIFSLIASFFGMMGTSLMLGPSLQFFIKSFVKNPANVDLGILIVSGFWLFFTSWFGHSMYDIGRRLTELRNRE